MNSRSNSGGELFGGFEPLTGNFLYCPNQFFDLCLPHHSRGAVRLVSHLLRKTLGWLNSDGTPVQQEISVSYRDLIHQAGVSRGAVRAAIDEATASNFIESIRSGQRGREGTAGQSAEFRLRWADGDYTKSPAEFRGFFAGQGHRSPIPNAFFDEVVPSQPLAVVKVVGTVLRHTVGYEHQFGRRQQAPLSYNYIQRYAQVKGRGTLAGALKASLERGYIRRVEEGQFSPQARQQRAACYAVRWLHEATSKPSRSKTVPATQTKNSTSGDPRIEPADPSNHRTSRRPVSVPAAQSKNRTTEKTPSKTTHKQTPVVADQEEAKKILIRAGYQSKIAEELAKKHPLKTIRQQIQWLPQRRVKENRLGMLRRAIEEGWSPPPEVESAQRRRQAVERDKRRQQQLAASDATIESQKQQASQRRAVLLQHWAPLSPDWKFFLVQQAIEKSASDLDRQRLRRSDPCSPEPEILDELVAQFHLPLPI